MPIYEYRCSECSFQDEFLQRLSDPLMTVCPKCGKESLKKMVTAAGFQLKGSGWYATDFKGSGSKPAAKTGEGDSKTAETPAQSASADGNTPAAKPAADKVGDKSATPPKAAPASTPD
jgi:putative FmdB family regulatory protein